MEELLLYLCQQRRQLDESKRLMENMEQHQQQQDVHRSSRVNVETAQSGTIPSVVTGQEYGSGGEGRRRRGGGGRVGSTGVDLSSLYEHCKIEGC